MANVSLMACLQQAMPPIPMLPLPDSRNTANPVYRYTDIHSVQTWHEFNLQRILHQYHDILNNSVILMNPPVSPPDVALDETTVKARLQDFVYAPVRRSLRVGFAALAANGQMQGRTALGFDYGSAARLHGTFKSDLALFDIGVPRGTAPNRAPGDVRPSWMWNTGLPTLIRIPRREYLQALSQVNFYMNQNNTRYGFILTDCELVAIRKLDRDGNLELSESIPWTAGGTAANPQLTVLLGLWYLGMLASDDQAYILQAETIRT